MTTTTDALPRLLDASGGRARAGTDADAVDGLVPGVVATPESTEAVAAVLRAAHEDGLAVVVRGAGTKLGWGAPPRRLDVVLDTTGLDELVEHAAGDLVVVTGAGRRLEDLQRDLAGAGQCLAVDPARRGTVGGLVATADAGPGRLGRGAVRDLVIGTTVVRADGVVARSGGKVVKNVAGYDLGKLLTGSFGTLGVLTRVALRLHPVPETSAWVTVPVASARHASALVQGVLHAQVVADAAELDRPGEGRAELAVRLDGIVPGVAARAERTAELLGTGAQVGDSAPGWWGRDLEAAAHGVTLKASYEPASLTALLEAVDDAAAAVGRPLAVRGSAAVGTLTIGLGDDGPGPERLVTQVATVLATLRGAAGRYGGAVVVRDAPPAVRAAVDVWGPVSGLDLMRRVKDRLDPTGVLAPGRFVGGI